MSATIYKIYCRNSEITECYVGSTEDFIQRCSEHKSRCNNTNGPKYNLKVYKFIRANGGWDNFIIEQIIDCDLEDRYDCELYYFKLFKAKLNSHFPKRSQKEWRSDNNEYLKEYHKQYYNDNKQQILEQNKQYYNDNKQQISEQNKQHYIDNREQILKQNKQHYIECECGSVVRKSDISTHRKTKKHQNYINSKL